MITFLEYANRAETERLEWVAGAVYPLEPLTGPQAAVRARLYSWLGDYIEQSGLGMLIPAPFPIRMPEEINSARMPELFYVPNLFSETMQERHVDSHGVGLVIELVDDRSRVRAANALVDYEQSGIPEVWRLDLDNASFELFVLGDDGYVQAAPDQAGRYCSVELPGLYFGMADLLPPGA